MASTPWPSRKGMQGLGYNGEQCKDPRMAIQPLAGQNRWPRPWQVTYDDASDLLLAFSAVSRLRFSAYGVPSAKISAQLATSPFRQLWLTFFRCLSRPSSHPGIASIYLLGVPLNPPCMPLALYLGYWTPSAQLECTRPEGRDKISLSCFPSIACAWLIIVTQ